MRGIRAEERYRHRRYLHRQSHDGNERQQTGFQAHDKRQRQKVLGFVKNTFDKFIIQVQDVSQKATSNFFDMTNEMIDYVSMLSFERDALQHHERNGALRSFETLRRQVGQRRSACAGYLQPKPSGVVRL